MQLYRNIRNRRLYLGLSQDALAKLTGYTDRSSIAKIESGKVDLSQSKIDVFARALGTTSAELMGWENEEIGSSYSISFSLGEYTMSELNQIKEYASFIKHLREK